ncbi:MAG: helix-turn-helix domain-containing protein [Polyangiaceae bacterium]
MRPSATRSVRPAAVSNPGCRAPEALELGGATVDDAASRARLSTSRFTHLVSDTLGPSPLTFRTWFKLRRAIGAALLNGANLTEAAHLAGFADSAHLTRTCKSTMGVRPAQMLPPVIHVSSED